MNLRRNIKSHAQQALQGCWAQARIIIILIVSLSLLISMLDSAVMGLLGYEFTYSNINSFSYSEDFFFSPVAITFTLAVWVIRLLILVPLGVGMVNWYRQLTDRRRLGVSYIFWVYEGRTWLRSMWVAITIGLRLVFVGALLFALPLIMIIEAEFLGWSPVLMSAVWVGGWLLALLAAFVLTLFAKRYSMVSLLLCEQYNMTAREAVRASVRYTKGHCFELLMVDLSFLPWAMPLILLTATLVATTTFAYNPFSLLPVLLAWLVAIAAAVTLLKVYPYYTMTQVMYARYLYEYGCSRDAQPAATGETVQTATGGEQVQPSAESEPQPAAEWQPIVDDMPIPLDPAPTQPASGVVWKDIDD